MELWESVVRMVSALGVVLALILGLLAVARSAIGRRFLPLSGVPAIKILANSPLGARKQVLLVAVAGEVLILGTTATDLVRLGKITDPEQLKLLLADASSTRPSPSSGPVRSDHMQEAHRVSC
ncbi:MAG: FliO/MopB family protein [Nitrospira defluvii]|nr:FliO/MopB family protein [Nitrospira defluvii]